MNLNEFLTTISSIGTFIAAIATCMTVREMYRQRRLNQLPNLLISSSKEFYIYKSISNISPSFSHWHNSPNVEIEDIEKIRENTFDLELFNVGIGPAILVSFKYSFDSILLEKFLKANGNFDSIEIIDKESNVTFNAIINGIEVGIWLGINDLEYKELIVSQSIDKPYLLKLPKLYLAAFNAYCISNYLKIPNDNYFIEFPKLNVEMVYQDIKYEEHNKKFEIFIHVDGIALNTDRTTEKISGKILTTEIH